MARIPADQVDRIKQGISLLRLVEGQGHRPKRQGKDYALCCPFHDDKTPSLIISPVSNLFNCFGCGASGSVIDWVMKTQGVSFRNAVEVLQGDVLSVSASKPIKKSTTRTVTSPLATDANDQALLRQVVDYYHQCLKDSPEVLDYLKNRGLDDPELIDTFKLGYANRTLGPTLPEKNRKAGAVIRSQLQRIGLYRQSGHEHFNGSLVIPVINGQGIITEVYGRKLLNNLRKGTPKHLYLPGPHKGIFNPACLNNPEIILCESLIDALTFWRYGFKNVTTSYGTGGFTDELLQAFKQHQVERILIAYDRDDAGNAAAEKLAKRLTSEGIDCYRVLFPNGMDANDYALKMHPADKALGQAIRKAEWVSGDRSAASQRRERPAGMPGRRDASGTTACEGSSSLDTTAQPGQPEEKTFNEQATPLPALPASDVTVQQGDNELFITLGERVYRVRGLDKTTSTDHLKINLLLKAGDRFHADKLDLYSSKQRQVFINQAAAELGIKEDIIKTDLGKLLLKLEEQQEQQQQENGDQSKQKTLNSDEKNDALALLTDAALLDRILADFDCAGVVGESTNKLVGYLSCVSRKLDKPLAVMIQSSSAAGKSALMESVLALMPEEERVQYSAMTGQSLFYMGETDLKNKILAISEEEGASNASYALKLLQSEGEVTIASTGKDDSTGNLVTKEYKVQGPVMLLMTTTAIDIDEELMNRCLVLSVNESREQTQAIHRAQRQRRTLAGLQAKLERDQIINIHRNAQRLLRPLHVINPYADQLTFLDDKTRTRRDHEKYLTLIDSIALLHQYQREIKTINHAGDTLEYIEVTLEDIEAANRLAHDVLGRTLDELPPQTRKLLTLIQAMVRRECKAQGIEQSHYRFSRKTIREATGWGNTQLKVHCHRLEEMEYLLVHRGGRGQSLEYELLYDGEGEGDSHLMGLIDTDTLQYDEKKSGGKAGQSGSSRPQVGAVSGAGRSSENTRQASDNVGHSEKTFNQVENAVIPPKNNSVASHRNSTSPLAAKGF